MPQTEAEIREIILRDLMEMAALVRDGQLQMVAWVWVAPGGETTRRLAIMPGPCGAGALHAPLSILAQDVLAEVRRADRPSKEPGLMQ